MKKILLLGGSTQQVPAIEYARSKGYYTVLCDYLPDNPGQRYADRFYCESTTDRNAILEVARKESVDGIVAYASDPAAPTAAFVAENLGLPTNPYASVAILAYKDLFRDFLRRNGFNCPHAMCFVTLDEARASIWDFAFPVMVKPVDSSGSKGVTKIESIDELDIAYEVAMGQSRAKRIITEEFIAMDHDFMIGGDCFVLDGKIAFWGLLNSHRNRDVNPFVPVGTSHPVQISEKRKRKIKKELQRLVDLLDIRFGAFNIEVMIDHEDEVFLIEMGPRNGGNMIPDLLQMITGVDLIGATVEAAMGNNRIDLCYVETESYYATYVLHTAKDGTFEGVSFDGGIEDKIIRKVIYKDKGESVQYFDGANKAIGIVFLKFSALEEMLDVMAHSERWIKVLVE